MKMTAPLLALLLVGCAQVDQEPEAGLEAGSETEPLPVLRADRELVEVTDAAVLLVESGKLLPLADALRSLGPEPNPAAAAAAMDQVLRVHER